MLADIFTKATDYETFVRMRDFMRNVPEGYVPARIARRVMTYVRNVMRMA